MGHLAYGNTSTPIDVDDALMAHLRTVIVTKLRRNESFPLTIEASSGVAETLWIHASIPLRFVMEDDDHALDRSLLVAMMNAANSARGLDMTSDEFSSAMQATRGVHALSA
ncbi:hypothetical protein HWD99_13740 [Microbacterium sp. C5A9]|uniref:DUF7882 family protein n=1 Tax=Microbacterium sp. C5A9 TaxID=2736663 RepID=UPI001F524470|nr:hypothetical protein [Microbacterium sp. C5A9]MCI1019688.1 hypothetical protein [Microbacterium sp. C5A9]